MWGTEQFRLAQAEGKLLRATDRRWWGFSVSQQPGSAGVLCDRDRRKKKNIPIFGCEWEFTVAPSREVHGRE